MEDSPFLPQLKQWASWGPDREIGGAEG